jgi:hypothetical protein
MPPLGELWPIVAATLPVAGFAALLLGAFISLVNFYLVVREESAALATGS